MKGWLLFLMLLGSLVSSPADVAVLTQHNNLAHTGANLEETNLTVANVNTNTFGLLYSRPVDDQVYAQPLVMTNVDIPGHGVHNLLIVATVRDTVYAFDADDLSVTEPYWTNSFIQPPAIVPPANADLSALGACGGNYNDFSGYCGIVGTPVIDPETGTLYVVARTKEPGTNFVQRLHALDVRTGQERSNSPVEITAIYPGTAVENVGGVIAFDPARQNQRPGLSLVDGVVYIAWASHCDLGPYHGWVMGYDATNLAQVVVYNNTPNGYQAGIWMSGEGISADTNGNLYLSDGNGSVGEGGDPRSVTNRAESILKLTRNGAGLTVTSWFTPYNYSDLEGADVDLGSAGVLLIPGTTLAFTGGKQGVGYLLDRDNMGGLSYSGADTNVLQTWSLVANQLHGGMVWWDGPTNSCGYIWPSTDYLQQYRFDRATNRFILPALAESPSSAPGGQPGGILAVSANGTNAGTGIIWASHQLVGDANQSVRPGILHAYDAGDVSHELWNSEQISSRDSVGQFAKFVPPTVANGKVYLATFSGRVNVYGLAVGWVSPTVILPGGGAFTNSVLVTLTNATPGAELYYTLDGSEPTTNSLLYTAPFTLAENITVKARGFKEGCVPSAVATASFLNSASIGNGTGLLGSYYSNQLKTFTNLPTLVRTDAVVNFNWGGGSPDPSISTNGFTVRWTGTVQPPLSDTYTFYTTTDDGVRLWVNGQLIIDHWVDQSAVEWSGTIALNGQQRYNLRMEYYENTVDAMAMLSWSSSFLSKQIIPQSQLYPATNPPPVAVVTAPTNGATYTASASVTVSVVATNTFNSLAQVNFYTNNVLFSSLTNGSGSSSNTFTLTATGLGAGSYRLTASAEDLTGLTGTSAPVNITVNAGSGAPYGLAARSPADAFLNMPASVTGSLPPLLSQTGVFTNTEDMSIAAAFIPYAVNTPLWSDGAVKTRYFMVPGGPAPVTPAEQISFATNGEWSFPPGSIFVKTFELATNEADPDHLRRLETRLLVRDTNGAVYGVTYKWRPDNSDADLLAGSSNEDIAITTPSGTRTQTWYYPSPSDCLLCHTPAANYVLGPKTGQLNGDFTYAATGATDNQLRTLNHLGLFNPAFDEAAISGFPQLAAVTNTSAPVELRARSYLDANCAHCHRPGGAGVTFDGRFDTPLTNQNLINAVLSKGDLGYDGARVVVPKDIWRSVLYARMNTTDPVIKMPELARNLIDTNAVQVMGDWINSLDGTPALAPPTILPNGGTFNGSIGVVLTHPDPLADIRYTLDGSLPTTNSALYSSPINLTSNLTVRAKAFETNYVDSVAANATFFIDPSQFTAVSLTNGVVHLFFAGAMDQTYVLEASTNLVNWVPVATNVAPAGIFEMTDPDAAQYQFRFYRTMKP